MGLLAALAALRTRGVDNDLVCSGRLTGHYPAIQRRVRELGLESRVHFVGYVDAADLAELYRRARALVFPSWFEGWGLPVVEAFAFDLPVACADNTCLPEVAGGAAALFDPGKPETMVQAILEVWSDEAARVALVEGGRRRAAELSWSRTARIYRAVYRRVAGRSLSDEDRELLAPPTLVEAPK
jgi:glycosyltransferase involved in cell wall biosynthesis